MIKKLVLGALLALSLSSTVGHTQTVTCSPDAIPVSSLDSLLKAADAKAGVISKREVFDEAATTVMYDFIEKKLGRSVDRHKMLAFLSRDGFPKVMVLVIDDGCAKFIGSLTTKEAQELRDVAKGV